MFNVIADLYFEKDGADPTYRIISLPAILAEVVARETNVSQSEFASFNSEIELNPEGLLYFNTFLYYGMREIEISTWGATD